MFISGNNNELAHESTTDVQNEFLKILESENTSVFGDYGKYVNVAVNNLLFVFAGAFNGEKDITIDRLREIGVKTEFLGRVGLIYNMNPLTLEDMYKILDQSELLDNYCKLFEGSVDRESVIYTIRAYLQKYHKNNTIGARVINTLVNQYFIKGGKLEEKEVKEITFQDKLTL